MKLYSLKIVFLLFACHVAPGQSSTIAWQEKVVIRDVPVFEGSRGKYGSEYARMLQLDKKSWLISYTVPSPQLEANKDHRLQLQIARSSDRGRSWTQVSGITDAGRDLDNAQMIRLPDKSILLACRSVRWRESYRLPVYRSTDNGKSWSELSTIDASEGKPGELGEPDKGVYEPHFYFLDDGRLAVMYANEKHVTDNVSYSQIISQKVSADGGKTWGKEIWVAYETGRNASRPGMPVWTKMKNGKYIAVYEVCGPEKCNIFYKISNDGFTWPVGLGTPIPDQLGGPYILSLTDGQLVVTSNQGNFSISDDYGQSWHKTERAWEHKQPFEKIWYQTYWPSLYQTGKNEIGAITSVLRDEGGHNVQIRFGKISQRIKK
jgi:hypothetical protein